VTCTSSSKGLQTYFFYIAFTRAYEMWPAIVATFNKGGPIPKIELFARVLSNPFCWDKPILDQYRSMMDNGIRKIFADPMPTVDEIGLMVMLYLLNNPAMSEELRSARTAIHYKPTTSHEDILEQLLNAEREIVSIVNHRLSLLPLAPRMLLDIGLTVGRSAKIVNA
jgi:hypothetical protein